MGHDGMLYSLRSFELIAGSIEYIVNAYCADAIVCISNCDKITPGMLIAAMRLNPPLYLSQAAPWRQDELISMVRPKGLTFQMPLSPFQMEITEGPVAKTLKAMRVQPADHASVCLLQTL